MTLTARQLAILTYIEDFTDHFHRPPTNREACAAFEIASPNGLTEHKRLLRNKGRLLVSRHLQSASPTPGQRVIQAAVEVENHPSRENEDALTEAVSEYQHRQELFYAEFVAK